MKNTKLFVILLALAVALEVPCAAESSQISSSNKAELVTNLKDEIKSLNREYKRRVCRVSGEIVQVVADTPQIYLVSVENQVNCTGITFSVWQQGALVLEDGTVKQISKDELFVETLALSGGKRMRLSDFPNYKSRLFGEIRDPRCLGWVEPQISAMNPAVYFTRTGIAVFAANAALHRCWPAVTYSYAELNPYLHSGLKNLKQTRH